MYIIYFLCALYIKRVAVVIIIVCEFLPLVTMIMKYMTNLNKPMEY